MNTALHRRPRKPRVLYVYADPPERWVAEWFRQLEDRMRLILTNPAAYIMAVVMRGVTWK